MPEGNGALTPEEATAELVVGLGEVVANVMLRLIARGSMAPAEAQQLLTSLLHPDPKTRLERARQALLQHAMLVLPAHGQ